MRLEYYPLEKLKSELLEIFSRNLTLNEYKIFFFGSRVSNTGDDRSDIDIGIKGGVGVPLSTMSKIKEDIEKLPILYKFDIVDMNSASESFKKVAEKDIEFLN